MTDTRTPENVARFPQGTTFEEYEPHDERERRANGADDQNALPFVWAADIEADLRVRDFVRGLLSSAAIGVVYGDSGTGKTFLMLHVAMSVALGLPLFGRRVERGSVLYVCIEGALGITNRIAAFRKHHGIAEGIPLGLTTVGVDLRNADADTARIIATAKVIDRTHPPLRMIVIDTLSGALAGGSDRDPQDTGALLANASRILAETGALVVFVHHAGKDASRGSRGDSRLNCDIDIELKVTRENGATVSTVTSTKQRDFPAGDAFAFSLASVELGTNELGEPVRSCVVTEEALPSSTGATPLTPNQETMFRILQAAGSSGLTTAEWHDRAKAEGVGEKRKATLFDCRDALRRKKLVRSYGDRWIAER